MNYTRGTNNESSSRVAHGKQAHDGLLNQQPGGSSQHNTPEIARLGSFQSPFGSLSVAYWLLKALPLSDGIHS